MEKRLDIKKFTCLDGAEMAINGEELYLSFQKGDWPEIKYALPNGLQGLNSINFDVKIKKATSLSCILYSGKRRAICDVSTMINQREFPNGEWVNVTWYFREKPDWITPPAFARFDFDKISAFSFCANGKNVGSMYQLKNITFSDKTIAQVDDSKFVKFLTEHKKGSLKDKKALIWANGRGDSPCTVQGVIERFCYYEKLKGFDGIIMEIAPTPECAFRDTVFTPENIDEAALNASIQAYKSFDWKQYQHNFIRLDIVGMGRFKNVDGSSRVLDWFDDELFYNVIYPKLTRFAKALKEMNVSLLFDNEAYTTEPYDYYYKYKASGRSFAEYEEKVRQRGREFAEVFAKAYPCAVIMMLYSNWVLRLKKEEDRYGLLPAFIDGMCEANTSLTLIDGYERGYGFSDYESVVKGVYDCTNQTPLASSVPESYKKNMHYGFGVWLRTDFFTKEEFATLSLNALRETEEYVWFYTECSPIEREDVQEYFSCVGKQKLEGK